MQRQRGELVPIGEVVSGLDDELVPAIRNDSPQARRGFTVADQVDRLVWASEAAPDRGFMARMMARCAASPAPTPETGSGADRIVGAIRSGVRRGDAAYAAMT